MLGGNMGFSDDVVGEVAEEARLPRTMEGRFLRTIDRWFEMVGIEEPPDVEVECSKVPLRDDYGQASGTEDFYTFTWRYDGYDYKTNSTASHPDEPRGLRVTIHTREGWVYACTRQQIGLAIARDRER